MGSVAGVEGSAEGEVVKSIRKSDKTDSAGRCVRVEKKLGARLACFLRAEEDSEADGASAAEEATGEEGVEVEVVGAVEIGIAGREERGAGFGSGRARREPDDDDDLALEELPRLLDWKVMPVAVLGREGTLKESSSVFTDVLLRCKNDRPFAMRLDLLACTEFSWAGAGGRTTRGTMAAGLRKWVVTAGVVMMEYRP